jgi:plasmid stabilization system protein ParE
MRIEWTVSSLADLDRFAQFLHERDPALATRIAAEIRERAQILADQPLLGRRLGEREEYRSIASKANAW